MANHKVERIASDITKYLSNILMLETNDELFKQITIIDVVVSKDLSFAKVYFTSLSSLSKKEIEKEINEASPFIRGKLASLIDARNIPFLKFTYDESIEYGNKIDDIIKKIHQND